MQACFLRYSATGIANIVCVVMRRYKREGIATLHNLEELRMHELKNSEIKNKNKNMATNVQEAIVHFRVAVVGYVMIRLWGSKLDFRDW